MLRKGWGNFKERQGPLLISATGGGPDQRGQSERHLHLAGAIARGKCTLRDGPTLFLFAVVPESRDAGRCIEKFAGK